jgi:hypothetical protein
MDEIAEFIKTSNLKNEELLAGILTTLLREYPDETERQHMIRATIMMFEAKYKPEMRQQDDAIRFTKETRKNEHAADYATDMRLGIRIHEMLDARINMVVKDPPFLSDEAIKMYDELNWFRKNFPRYVVPETF